MARRWLPDNVTKFTDKTGRTRYRFRKKGLPQYLFRHEPGTPEFMAEYSAARKAQPASKYAPGSFHALIDSYYRSKRFRDMRPISQRMRQNALERFRKQHGDKPVKALEARHIDRWMADMVDRPHAANDLRKMLKQLMRHARLLGWRADDPTEVIDPYKQEGDGYHCWTEDEIAQFEACWPLGTRERLAMTLLLYTGLRRSDMVNLGRQHVRGGKFVLHHGKNDSTTTIPIMGPLQDAIDAMQDEKHLTYLVTRTGKAFTAAGFGNWFRDRCNDAGLPHCSAHGLRKALARRLADAGATHLQGRAVTGHKSDAMFSHYAASANREAMADQAMGLVANHLAILPFDPKKGRKTK